MRRRAEAPPPARRAVAKDRVKVPHYRHRRDANLERTSRAVIDRVGLGPAGSPPVTDEPVPEPTGPNHHWDAMNARLNLHSGQSRSQRLGGPAQIAPTRSPRIRRARGRNRCAGRITRIAQSLVPMRGPARANEAMAQREPTGPQRSLDNGLPGAEAPGPRGATIHRDSGTRPCASPTRPPAIRSCRVDAQPGWPRPR